MKILIICYCYPPDVGPRASRWSAIAEFWASEGHQVHVISALKMDALAIEDQNGVQVHRVGGAFSENLRLRLENRSKKNIPHDQEKPIQSAPGGASLFGLGRFLKAVHDLTWKKIYWPESTCMWFFPARAKALELARKISFDAVISTSTPYTGHLVGKAVKRAYPAVPWTVDIGDPFSFGQPPWNNINLYERLNHRSEAAILKQADSISVTVASCKTAYSGLFPGCADKITVIPPLFSGTVRSPWAATEKHKGARLVFTGSLYRDIRNPAYLLKLLSRVFEKSPDTEAHFYGRLNDCADLFDPLLKQYPNNIFIHGLVTREVAADALEQASILINIANRARHQLPSKLVDYMATGKPILNIVSIEDDNSIPFLNDYPNTTTFVEQSKDVADEDAERFYNFVANPKVVSQVTVIELLKQFQVPAVETQYRQLMRSGIK